MMTTNVSMGVLSRIGMEFSFLCDPGSSRGLIQLDEVAIWMTSFGLRAVSSGTILKSTAMQRGMASFIRILPIEGQL